MIPVRKIAFSLTESLSLDSGNCSFDKASERHSVNASKLLCFYPDTQMSIIVSKNMSFESLKNSLDFVFDLDIDLSSIKFLDIRQIHHTHER